MMRVKITTSAPYFPLVRQTPGGNGLWGDCRFFVDDDTRECDAWVVFDNVTQPQWALCPPANVILVTWEPPTIKTYSPGFVRQFAKIVTCNRGLKHRDVVYAQQGLPWIYGVRISGPEILPGWLGYDHMKSSTHPPKTRNLSVINSSKASTEGHLLRATFVDALVSRLGSAVDVFGRGIRDVEDKRDAIQPYRYHIALENSVIADYWTEKLSDSFLGGAYPFYFGCPNITDYFPTRCLTQIDIRRPAEAIEIIERTIESGVYERSAAALREAAELVLDRYNLFALAAGLVNRPATERRRVDLDPCSGCGPLSRWGAGLKRSFVRLSAAAADWPKGNHGM